MKLITSLPFVEVIYELGTQSSEIKTTSVFNESPATYTELTHYYLLVLIPKGENLRPHEVQDKVENSCRSIVPVTALIMFLEDFIKLATDGRRFANTVCKNATLVFTKHLDTLVPVKDSVHHKESAEIWTREYNQVNELLKGIEFYIDRKQVRMALFIAHQAAITLLHHFFKKSTWLSLQTQNFDKLIRYCSLVSCLPQQVFPKQTEKDLRIYSMLQQAKSLAVNTKEYIPTIADVALILENLRCILI